jgi:GntR family transcriptional regulator/MocR family aminotransferase
MRGPGWGELIDIGVESNGAAPLYRQLYHQVRTAILAQRLRPGTKLPSSRALAARLGIARLSVVGAYDQLLSEGYVIGRVGAGTFVSTDLPEALETSASKAAPRPVAALPRPTLAAKRISTDVDSDPGKRVPFGTGFGTIDARSLDAWRRLTIRAAHALGQADLGYSDPQGLINLRIALSDYLRAARGVRCEPDQIIVTAGTQQAIDLVTRVVLEPGDQVWVEDPGYGLTYAALSAAGIKVQSIPVDPYGIDVTRGVRVAPRARAVVVTPSNQFPLGVVLSMARRMELLAWAREANAWIIEDDYDSEFRYAGRPLAALQGLDESERTIYIGSFSKLLFPGLRLGYAVVPDFARKAFVDARRLTDRHPPTFNQLVACEFIRQGHFAAHLRRTRLIYREHRDALVAELKRHLGEEVWLAAPDQGKHLLAYLPDGLADTAVEQAARRRGIATRSLSRLYRKAPPRSALVLGFTGYNRELLVSAASRLAEVVRQAIEASAGVSR